MSDRTTIKGFLGTRKKAIVMAIPKRASHRSIGFVPCVGAAIRDFRMAQVYHRSPVHPYGLFGQDAYFLCRNSSCADFVQSYPELTEVVKTLVKAKPKKRKALLEQLEKE